MTVKKEPLHAKIITLFPDLFPGFLGQSLTGKALENKKWSYETITPRDFATDVHKTVDDTPFGGGAGMVMKPDVLDRTLRAHEPIGRFIYMSPRGAPLTQAHVEELSQEPLLTILCGRYEGVDQRLLDAYSAEEISIGDYVLTGGEQAAMVMLDAIVRILPNVLGNADTHLEESFSNGLLEYPHYTRPAKWEDPAGTIRDVPNVLTTGHHANILKWRLKESERLTKERRPDLWEEYLKEKEKNKE